MVKISYCPLSCLVNNKSIEECNYIWDFWIMIDILQSYKKYFFQ